MRDLDGPAATPSDGVLYVVGTPIGNPDDISLRALSILRSVSMIACEERREAARFLHRHRIEAPLIASNEHTEQSDSSRVIGELTAGASVALISDCGMPVFADPGTHLIQEALARNIRVDVVPGPTSLTSALVLTGFDIRRFYFHGFLSPKSVERRTELRALRELQVPIVFLDAPYRLSRVLDDLALVFGARRAVCVACDLTLPDQFILRGTLEEARHHFARHTEKREFVIILGWDTASRDIFRREPGGMARPRKHRD